MTQQSRSDGESRTAPYIEGNLPAKTSHYRWVVCALLFCATSIIYVDRQVWGMLAPSLTEKFQWTESNYSFIVNAFTIAYALGYALGGRVMDIIGVRKGFIILFCVWSTLELTHGLVGPLVDRGLPWMNAAFAGTILGSLTPAIVSVAGFSLIRFFLGLVEGGHFPGAIKTVGQWHPKKERAFSTGLFNSGSNIGTIIALATVPFILRTMHWGATFFVTGILGFIWAVIWFFFYRNPERHPRVSPAELALIQSDPPDPSGRIPWLSLLGYRQTWAFVAAMFLVSPVWWFYINWLPKFLKNNHNIDSTVYFLPLLVVYLMADAGSIAGGSLSSWLIKRGDSINVARKSTFLFCAICALPVIFVPRINSMWLAVIIIGLACAAHSGFSANLYTIVSDTVPRKAVSSVVGMGGTAAGVGFFVFSTLIGQVLDWTKKHYGEKDYLIPFMIAGLAYLAATAIIHLLLPRLEPMKFDEAPDPVANN
jgi:ACS family hexuronate transporter-like MFS transporter